jgi:hypothetical protein
MEDLPAALFDSLLKLPGSSKVALPERGHEHEMILAGSGLVTSEKLKTPQKVLYTNC